MGEGQRFNVKGKRGRNEETKRNNAANVACKLLCVWWWGGVFHPGSESGHFLEGLSERASKNRFKGVSKKAVKDAIRRCQKHWTFAFF